LFRPLNSLVYKNALPDQDMCVAACLKASIDQSFGKNVVSIGMLNKAGRYKKAWGTPLDQFARKANVELQKKNLEVIAQVYAAPNVSQLKALLQKNINPVIVVPWLDFLKWKGDATVIIPEDIPPEDLQYHALTVVDVDDQSVLVYDPDCSYREADLNNRESYTRIDFPTLYQLWGKALHRTFWPTKLNARQDPQQTKLPPA